MNQVQTQKASSLHEATVCRDRLKHIIFNKSFQYSTQKEFKLSSGAYSHYYFNCKRTTLDPEGMHYIGHLFFERLHGQGIKGVGGLTLGADPIANAVAIISYQKGQPINPFVVRKELKDHGIINWIEGNVDPGDSVAIVDDVITTGNSTIQAVQRATDSGLMVKKILILVDREEGGRNIFRNTHLIPRWRYYLLGQSLWNYTASKSRPGKALMNKKELSYNEIEKLVRLCESKINKGETCKHG